MRNQRSNPSADRSGGAQSSVAADFVLQFSRIVNSTVADTGAVQMNVAGIGGLDLSDPNNPLLYADDDDDGGEAIEGAEQFSSPGIVGRPLPPETLAGQLQFMEVCCVRTADGLVPISYRDTRVKMGGSAPGVGTFAFVGYGGGFHSLSPVEAGGAPAGGGTLHVIYCPYDFDANGVAQKAHSIVLDPTSGNESISIVHARGMAMLMNDDKLTLRSQDGSAFIQLDNGKIVLGGDVTISGGLVIGADGTPTPKPIALMDAGVPVPSAIAQATK